MLDITFATAYAYNYRTSGDEVVLGFRMHEVAGEPGTFRFVANGYRADNAEFVGLYADVTVDVYNVRDTGAVLRCLFAAADECIREAYNRFDVFFNLTDRDNNTWLPFNHVGRNLLAVAYEREGVDTYPWEHEDVKRLASFNHVYPLTMNEVKEFLTTY